QPGGEVEIGLPERAGVFVGGQAHHPGVPEPAGAAEETMIAHAEGRARGVELADAVPTELVSLDGGEPGQGRHVDLALLTEGAGDERHVGSGGRVAGHRRPGADRLVVGVRVHEQDAPPGLGVSRDVARQVHGCNSTHPDCRDYVAARAPIGMTIDRLSREHSGVDYPELAARTRRVSYGVPRGLTATGDGAPVVFLRSSGPEDPADGLWVFDVETGQERLMVDPADLLSTDGDLPPQERALRERLRLSTSGIGS